MKSQWRSDGVILRSHERNRVGGLTSALLERDRVSYIHRKHNRNNALTGCVSSLSYVSPFEVQFDELETELEFNLVGGGPSVS